MDIEDLKKARRLYVKNLKGEPISYAETYIMQFMHYTIKILEKLSKEVIK